MPRRAPTDAIHVAVAVIADAQGRVLIAQRAPQLHQGGLWEFPGGKVERGESVQQALVRELREELNVQVLTARPLIQVLYVYPQQKVYLDVWQVGEWRNAPQSREHQAWQWVETARLSSFTFPAANLPILSAIGLPVVYAITPGFPASPIQQQDFLNKLNLALDGGLKILQLRAWPLPRAQLLIEQVCAACHARGCRVIWNGDAQTAQSLGVDGVHFSSARLRQVMAQSPARPRQWLSVACHSPQQLALAETLAADCALLAPVCATRSHQHVTPIGWDNFSVWKQTCQLPVYALGGLQLEDLPTAWHNGAHGVALISGIWDPHNIPARMQRARQQLQASYLMLTEIAR